jgi:hypothetical protein
MSPETQSSVNAPYDGVDRTGESLDQVASSFRASLIPMARVAGVTTTAWRPSMCRAKAQSSKHQTSS